VNRDYLIGGVAVTLAIKCELHLHLKRECIKNILNFNIERRWNKYNFIKKDYKEQFITNDVLRIDLNFK
jgi:hypothetical protein